MESRNSLPENKFILLNNLAEIRQISFANSWNWIEIYFDLMKLTPFSF